MTKRQVDEAAGTLFKLTCDLILNELQTNGEGIDSLRDIWEGLTLLKKTLQSFSDYNFDAVTIPLISIYLL